MTIGGFTRREEPLSLPYRQNTIAFTFESAGAGAGQLSYQWRLADLMPEWSSPGAGQFVQFAGLPPGEYRFEIMVCDALNRCDVLAEPYLFVVERALWHHWWFWLALIVIIGIIGFIVVRRRIRSMELREEQKRRVLEARIKALEMEQKALQLQMNPHFVFNVMQTIQSNMARNHFAKARHNMARFSGLMRTMLNLNRQKRVTLEDEIEFLEKYLQMENLCRAQPFTFRINVDENVETFAVEIPPMLIQPIVENAVKHGSAKDDAEIDVHFSESNDRLICEVRDNGPGFRQTEESDPESAGLDIIRERLRHLGPGATLHISEGKKDKGKNRSGGTTVTVEIPLS